LNFLNLLNHRDSQPTPPASHGWMAPGSADSASIGTHLVLCDDVGNLICKCGYPIMCGAHQMLLSRRRRRELRRDLELEKSSKTGKKTGNAPFNWSRDGNRTTYTKIPFLSLKEAHGQCERDFVSRIQFSRPTSRFFSNQ
jgi:hypothetical protein